MKILMATRERQRAELDDRWSAVEGQIIFPPRTCPDPLCMCAYTFEGLWAPGTTTTAEVGERSALTRRGCIALAQAELDAHGHPHAPNTAADMVDRMLAVAASHAVGEVIERAGTEYRARSASSMPPPLPRPATRGSRAPRGRRS